MNTLKSARVERGEKTRRLLLDATIDMLLESGLATCSLAAVAKRAGMTTGAVQHHFKTKAVLMHAVIAECLFADNREIKPGDWADMTLGQRCQMLVEHQWHYYGKPRYIAIWDIILGARTDKAIQHEIASWQRVGIKKHEDLIAEVLSDWDVKTHDVSMLQYFMNSHLRGLSLLRTVEDDQRIVDAQLGLLGAALTRQVEALSAL
ncbi:MAG: TetR/AcrR family transcriptional regulator [Hyphomonadaceae bacterium]